MREQLLTEISIHTSRASGPGGQHVNKTESRVELHWNLKQSSVLTEDQKSWFQDRVGKRLTTEGVLILVSQRNRSQLRNREDVTERFLDLVMNSIQAPVRRKATKPSRRAIERRLQEKKKRSDTKKGRSGSWD